MVPISKCLNGIEVWLKLCKGLSLSAAELKNFSKILNGNVITKSGRRNLESLDPDLFYTLDDIIERCSLKRECQDAVDECLESIGQGDRLHYVGTSAGGAITIWQSEDPDFDDSQSKRWRGG